MKSAFEDIISIKVSEGDLNEAMVAAQMAGRSLTEQEIRKILFYQARNFRLEIFDQTLKWLRPSRETLDELANKEIDLLNYQYGCYGSIDRLITIAKYGASEKILRQTIERYHPGCLDMHSAQKIIALLKSPTSNSEIVDLYLERVYKTDSWGTDLMTWAIRFGASKQMVEKIREYWVKKGNLKFAREIASYCKNKQQELTKDELEEILSQAISSGRLDTVTDILPLLKRSLTEEEVTKFIKAKIQYGGLKPLIEFTQKYLGRDPTTKEVDRLIRSNAFRGCTSSLSDCLKYANRKLTQKEANLVIKSFIKHSWHSWDSLMDFLRETETIPSKEVLSELLKSGKWIHVPIREILFISRIIGRPPTEEELKMAR